jgi:hypothetical protein
LKRLIFLGACIPIICNLVHAGPTDVTTLSLFEAIHKYESVYGIPRGLLAAVIKYESGFNTRAINTPENPGVAVASYGLGQLTLATAKYFCQINKVKDLFQPEKNLACAAKVLSHHLLRFQAKRNPVSWAVSAYNAGEPAVCVGGKFMRFGKTLPQLDGCKDGTFQNKKYVGDVLLLWNKKSQNKT